MGVNKFKPHLWVLPEDDANRQMANGFELEPAVDATRIAIYPPSGGWHRVLEEFEADHVDDLRRYPQRHLVLLIDFDGQADRIQLFRSRIPQDVSDRVYVLGAHSEAEPLKTATARTFEQIGRTLAKDCADDNPGLWNHALLQHNQAELARLRDNVRGFLFPAAS